MSHCWIRTVARPANRVRMQLPGFSTDAPQPAARAAGAAGPDVSLGLEGWFLKPLGDEAAFEVQEVNSMITLIWCLLRNIRLRRRRVG